MWIKLPSGELLNTDHIILVEIEGDYRIQSITNCVTEGVAQRKEILAGKDDKEVKKFMVKLEELLKALEV